MIGKEGHSRTPSSHTTVHTQRIRRFPEKLERLKLLRQTH